MSNSTQNGNVIDLGPRDLQTTGKPSPFLLSMEQWASISKYVGDSLKLPTTAEEFKKLALIDQKENIDHLNPIFPVYSDVKAHCTTWKDSTYPATVKLASDMVSYAGTTRTRYTDLNWKVRQYTKSRDPQEKADLEEEIRSNIDTLKRTAQKYANNAAKVEQDITTFANQTKQDQTNVAHLKKEYSDKYKKGNGELETLQTQIDAQKEILDKANADYRHAVVVAATTVTYAWIPIYGWIAGPVVAGVYGAKATAALKLIKETKEKIAKLDSDFKRDFFVVNTIDLANKGIEQVLKDINEALPVIQKIQGIWKAINDDLTRLLEIFTEGLEGVAVKELDLGLDEAIVQWKRISDEADAFRVNAYVDFQESEVA
ncbi:MAG: alpha-xenorhabdolysin family binary toxin subunit A [Tumebacillaceae bacterium]